MANAAVPGENGSAKLIVSAGGVRMTLPEVEMVEEKDSVETVDNRLGSGVGRCWRRGLSALGGAEVRRLLVRGLSEKPSRYDSSEGAWARADCRKMGRDGVGAYARMRGGTAAS